MEKIPRFRKHLEIIIKFIKLLAKSRRVLKKKKPNIFTRVIINLNKNV